MDTVIDKVVEEIEKSPSISPQIRYSLNKSFIIFEFDIFSFNFREKIKQM